MRVVIKASGKASLRQSYFIARSVYMYGAKYSLSTFTDERKFIFSIGSYNRVGNASQLEADGADDFELIRQVEIRHYTLEQS